MKKVFIFQNNNKNKNDSLQPPNTKIATKIIISGITDIELARYLMAHDIFSETVKDTRSRETF